MSQATTGLINIILSCEKRKRHTCWTVKTATKNNNWYILRAQNLFLFANVRVNLSKEKSVFIKIFIKMFISKEYVEKYGKNNKKLTYQLTHVNSSLLFFCCKIQIKGKPALEYFLTREKSHG